MHLAKCYELHPGEKRKTINSQFTEVQIESSNLSSGDAGHANAHTYYEMKEGRDGKSATKNKCNKETGSCSE